VDAIPPAPGHAVQLAAKPTTGLSPLLPSRRRTAHEIINDRCVPLAGKGGGHPHGRLRPAKMTHEEDSRPCREIAQKRIARALWEGSQVSTRLVAPSREKMPLMIFVRVPSPPTARKPSKPWS